LDCDQNIFMLIRAVFISNFDIFDCNRNHVQAYDKARYMYVLKIILERNERYLNYDTKNIINYAAVYTVLGESSAEDHPLGHIISQI